MDEDSSRNSDDDPLSSCPRATESRAGAASATNVETRQFCLKSELYVAIGAIELMGIGLSIMAFFIRKPDDFWGLQAVALLFFHVPCALGAWWLARTRVVTDQEGIHFCGFFRTRFAAWGDIEDFGWEVVPENQGSNIWLAALWIGGKKKRLSRLVVGFDELREVIATRTVNAAEHEWQLVGTRECDGWPQTFVYRDTPNWQIGAWFFGMVGLMVLKIWSESLGNGWGAMVSNITLTWEGLETGGRIEFVFTLAFMLFGLPTLLVLTRFAGLGGKRRFLQQHIVATREGLEWWNGPSRRVVRWDEIESFELEPMRGHLQRSLCVVFGRKQRFEFHSGIEKGRFLCAMIAQKAVNATTRDWKTRPGADDDNLSDELSLWPSGTVGVGVQRYHYRTRTNRALLLFAAALTIACCFFFFYGRAVHGTYHPPDFGERVMDTVFGLPCLLALIGGVLAWMRSCLEVDENGLRHRSLWNTRELKWEEIRRLCWNGYFFEVKGEHTTMRIGQVVALDYLMKEIEAKSGVKIEKSSRTQTGA